MTVQWIEREDELVRVPEGSATTSTHPDYRFPKPYLDAVREADRGDLGAEFAVFAGDALEWAEQTLPAASIRDEA